jgi:hypothetical protein
MRIIVIRAIFTSFSHIYTQSGAHNDKFEYISDERGLF